MLTYAYLRGIQDLSVCFSLSGSGMRVVGDRRKAPSTRQPSRFRSVLLDASDLSLQPRDPDGVAWAKGWADVGNVEPEAVDVTQMAVHVP